MFFILVLLKRIARRFAPGQKNDMVREEIRIRRNWMVEIAEAGQN